jgi:hypothetical protein
LTCDRFPTLLEHTANALPPSVLLLEQLRVLEKGPPVTRWLSDLEGDSHATPGKRRATPETISEVLPVVIPPKASISMPASTSFGLRR